MRHVAFIDKSKLEGFIASIDGAKIQTKHDYLSIMEKAFHLPPCHDSWDAYLDWMCDLDWIEEKKITLIILNSARAFQQDPQMKQYMIDDFKDVILPFWEEEVKYVVVGGEPREFQVYLVD